MGGPSDGRMGQCWWVGPLLTDRASADGQDQCFWAGATLIGPMLMDKGCWRARAEGGGSLFWWEGLGLVGEAPKHLPID